MYTYLPVAHTTGTDMFQISTASVP